MTRFFPVVLLCFAYGAVAQSSPSHEAEIKRLLKSLNEAHVQPRAIDDSFSQWNFDNLLRELDPDAMYFTAQDVQSLSVLRTRIDDELKASSPWTFLPKVTALYQASLERYKQGIIELSSVAIDFNNQSSFTPDTTFEATAEKLKLKWALEFRINTFGRLYDRSIKKPGQPEKEFLSQNEKLAREQVSRVMLRSAEKYLSKPNGVRDFVAAKFMNSITNSFDPHSSYFSPQKIKEYMASLSSKGAYYGFGLDENEEGEVCITELKPGGSAWKSGQIFEGDVIEEIQFGSEPAIEVFGFSVEDVVSILDESPKNEMKLTVRNAEGVSRSVALRKEAGDSEENVVKSFLLTGKQKVGLISLPAFYSSWSETEQGRCANDVAREVVKLKREHVDGIILDIRFNGGGLMDEAVAMAGIFIDAGPMVALKDKSGDVKTIKDMNRGTIYDGPLLVLINGASASASELFAAAMQDYNRAIVVGGTTYGKGTAQQIFPTANTAGVAAKRTMKSLSPGPGDSGFASITIGRFYRVTGKTNQFVGVVPDIAVSDILSKLTIGERYAPCALASDSVQKKMYYQPLPPLPIDALAAISQQRKQNNPAFAATEKYSEWISNFKTNEVTVSKWTEYKKARNQDMEMITRAKEEMLNQTSAFKAIPTPNSIAAGQPDEYDVANNNRWSRQLEQDLLLEEGFNIMCDFIKMVGKK